MCGMTSTPLLHLERPPALSSESTCPRALQAHLCTPVVSFIFTIFHSSREMLVQQLPYTRPLELVCTISRTSCTSMCTASAETLCTTRAYVQELYTYSFHYSTAYVAICSLFAAEVEAPRTAGPTWTGSTGHPHNAAQRARTGGRRDGCAREPPRRPCARAYGGGRGDSRHPRHVQLQDAHACTPCRRTSGRCRCTRSSWTTCV